jgi:ABC-type transporter Mla MlaB component
MCTLNEAARKSIGASALETVRIKANSGSGRELAVEEGPRVTRKMISAWWRTGVIDMLRITITETAAEQRWTVEGRLVGPWVSELRTSWKKRHRAQKGRACTVDLSGVTFIDKGGVRLLRTMSREVTQFMATGIYTKHVVDQLRVNGERGLLKMIFSVFAALLGGVIPPLSRTPASPQRPQTSVVQATTIDPNSTNQRQGISAASFFQKSKREEPWCQLKSQTR